MSTNRISLQNSGYLSPLLIAYLNRKKDIQNLYHRFPELNAFKAQIKEKKDNFPFAHREVLVDSLLKQYGNFETTEKVLSNIELLRKTNTFTVTTGHQLNLFTGPLYFLYKIISTIKLCEKLKVSYPEYNFVPVYWMATEDHDFDEINHFVYQEKVIHWNKSTSGPVGRIHTNELEEVYEVFSSHLGFGHNADQLRTWFKNAYLNHDSLSDATRYLVNELFKTYGLVIVDADQKELKELFIPHLRQELLQRDSKQAVEKSFEVLKDYSIQVNPRDINLFYITDTLRERIVYQNNTFEVLHSSIRFTNEELETEITSHPERFSPNVILRPLYQEVILPNLCYIGGGGELAYWLELKEVFAQHRITFPMLLLRNSALLVSGKTVRKASKLELTWQDFFLPKETLLTQKTREWSQNTFDFNKQTQFLEAQFKELEHIALKTDPSFIGAVRAQKQKQINGLLNLEKRLLKAEKRVHQEQLKRIAVLHGLLFPGNSLQERIVNFSEFYKEAGAELIPTIYRNLDPLSQDFAIITL